MSPTGATAQPSLAGCVLTRFDSMACESYLAWLLGEAGSSVPAETTGLAWALAHCDDGVTWGRHDVAATAWRLGSQAVPDRSPPLRRETLQELRLFGEAGEVLIWRTEAGLRGRWLREPRPPTDASDQTDPLRPSDESRIIRGDRVVAQCMHGFTHIGDGTGAQQVLPLVVTRKQLRAAQVRLGVRHFFEQDTETGAVRIAATRLVELVARSSDG